MFSNLGKFKKILILSSVILANTLLITDVVEASRGSSSGSGGGNANVSSTRGEGNLLVVNIGIAGSESPGKVNSDGTQTKTPSEPACYIYDKDSAQSSKQVLESLDVKIDNGNGTLESPRELINNYMKVKDPSNPTPEELKNIKNTVGAYLAATKGENVEVSSEYYLDYRKYEINEDVAYSVYLEAIGKSNTESKKQLENTAAYSVRANPSVSADEYTEDGRCGTMLSQSERPMFYIDTTREVIAGENNVKKISDAVGINNKGYLNLDGSSGSYTATLSFKNNLSEGIVPKRVNNVYWVWAARTGGTTAGQTTTAGLPNVGTPSVSVSFNGSGSPNGLNTGALQSALVSYSNGANQCLGGSGTYGVSYNQCILSNSLRTALSSKFSSSETNVAYSINSLQDKSVLAIVKASAKSGGQVSSVNNGKMTYADVGAMADSASIGVSAGSGENGSYVVTVSVIADLTYTIPTSSDGSALYSFNYPFGILSQMDAEIMGCSEIKSKFNNGSYDEVVTDKFASENAAGVASKQCRVTVYTPPKAVAVLTPTGANEIDLDGSLSTDGYFTHTYYAFSVNTDTRCEEGTSDETMEVDGETIVVPCPEETYYKSLSQKKINTEVVIDPIVKYEWNKKYRVQNEREGRYEIELDNDVSSKAIIEGDLYSGNTFACLKVTTKAGKTAGAKGNNDGPVNVKTHYNGGAYTKEDGLKAVRSGRWAWCDATRSDDGDRLIQENW